MKTTKAVEIFLTAKKIQGCKDQTIESWQYKLGRFARQFPTLPLKPEKIENFLGDKNWKVGTRDTYYRLLINCYKFLQSRGHIKTNPMIAVMRPKLEKKNARSFDEKEIQLILNFDYDPAEYCLDQGRILINNLLKGSWNFKSLTEYLEVGRQTVYRWHRGIYAIPQDKLNILLELNGAAPLTPFELLNERTHRDRKYLRPFIYLLMDTGIRLGEALSVNESSFHDGFVEVSGKVGDRVVPVSPIVEQLCKSVLPWPWERSYTAGQAVRRALKRVGIKGERASAHTLRHTFCRNWDSDESVLVDIMGWTSPRMLSVYRPFNKRVAKELHESNSPLSDTSTAIRTLRRISRG
tara:strand:+ start:7554 stop:8606 length:1053 start_codon:yes stop_codon:yes gene_type:complete